MLVTEYYCALDNFLLAQFDYLAGRSDQNKTNEAYQKCLNTLLNSPQENLALESSRKFRIKELTDNQPIYLNFSTLSMKNIPDNQDDIYSYLESCRDKINHQHNISLSPIDQRELIPLGLNIARAPRSWHFNGDGENNLNIDIEALMTLLFEQDQTKKKDITFYEISKSDHSFSGFFMAYLPFANKYLIAHPKLLNIQDYLLLAHEIGHTSTFQETNLPKRFNDKSECLFENSEIDSLKYESIFIRHLNLFFPNIESSTIDRLYKYKAIKHNLNILSHNLNQMFFNARSMTEIEKYFQNLIINIYPQHEPTSRYEWLEYAHLNKPFSRVPYIKGYKLNFS